MVNRSGQRVLFLLCFRTSVIHPFHFAVCSVGYDINVITLHLNIKTIKNAYIDLYFNI